MRICIVYDCLYPWTVGGAERWYRQLATELATAGHDVTYLTRRQWGEGEGPSIDGVRVVAVSPGGPLYDPAGRRLPVPPLRFGAGVGLHLARHRSAYDVVHTCSFPYFSLPAVRLALAGTGTRVQVDWFELWSRRYWLGYAGPVLGRVGRAVQRLCVRLTPKAFAFSDLTAGRLRAEGFTGDLVRLSGLYGGPLEPSPSIERPDPPLVVYAGRHTFEKQVDAVPPALAAARRHLPGLRGIILGDGPLRASVLSSIAELGLGEAVEAPGFVPSEEVAATMKAATCLVVPSMREGYGLVVVEAASWATPVVVVAGEDNAAVELVEEGVNGFVVPDRSPESIARGILAVHEGGPELRSRCASWFRRRAAELTSSASVRRIVEEVGPPAPHADDGGAPEPSGSSARVGATFGRGFDEVRVEVARMVSTLRSKLARDGAIGVSREVATLIAAHATYRSTRRRRSSARCRFDGVELPYVMTRYNHTWLNERSFEIAVAKHLLSSWPLGRMLEVGNVLGHYGIVGHDVLDRYERVKGVMNGDIVHWTTDEPYDLAVAISTLEHVRFDEEEKDPHGPLRGLEGMRRAVRPGGRLLVTVPLGYNPGLDADVRGGSFAFSQRHFFRRVSAANDWREVDLEEALAYPYGSVYRNANAVLVGVDHGAWTP